MKKSVRSSWFFCVALILLLGAPLCWAATEGGMNIHLILAVSPRIKSPSYAIEPPPEGLDQSQGALNHHVQHLSWNLKNAQSFKMTLSSQGTAICAKKFVLNPEQRDVSIHSVGTPDAHYQCSVLAVHLSEDTQHLPTLTLALVVD